MVKIYKVMSYAQPTMKYSALKIIFLKNVSFIIANIKRKNINPMSESINPPSQKNVR